MLYQCLKLYFLQQTAAHFFRRHTEVFTYLTAQQHSARLQTIRAIPVTVYQLQCLVSALTLHFGVDLPQFA